MAKKDRILDLYDHPPTDGPVACVDEFGPLNLQPLPRTSEPLQNRYNVAMSTEIRQSELRNDNADIMRRVGAGESFVVTVNGRPVADVVPHQRDTGRRRFVPVAEAIAALTATPVDAEQWWHDIREGGDELSGPDAPSDPWERVRGEY